MKRGMHKIVASAHFTVRPDGKVSYERQGEEKDFLLRRSMIFGNPANHLLYDPGEKQRIPKAGAWVMITRKLPPIEKRMDEKIRVARIFYAEHDGEADEYGFLPDGSYKITVRSPWGDVKILPYEYSTIDTPRLMSLWQDKELIFHPTNVELTRMNDIVFYARSRGMGIADAMVLALGTLRGPVGWFEPAADLVKSCEEMEHRIHNWVPKRTLKKPMEVTIEVMNAAQVKELNRRAEIEAKTKEAPPLLAAVGAPRVDGRKGDGADVGVQAEVRGLPGVPESGGTEAHEGLQTPPATLKAGLKLAVLVIRSWVTLGSINAEHWYGKISYWNGHEHRYFELKRKLTSKAEIEHLKGKDDFKHYKPGDLTNRYGSAKLVRRAAIQQWKKQFPECDALVEGSVGLCDPMAPLDARDPKVLLRLKFFWNRAEKIGGYEKDEVAMKLNTDEYCRWVDGKEA